MKNQQRSNTRGIEYSHATGVERPYQMRSVAQSFPKTTVLQLSFLHCTISLLGIILDHGSCSKAVILAARCCRDLGSHAPKLNTCTRNTQANCVQVTPATHRQIVCRSTGRPLQGYTKAQHVSCPINHNLHISIYDIC